MYRLLSILILGGLLSGVGSARAQDQGYRKWKSKSGASVTAKFVKRTGDRIRLLRSDGRVVSVPVSGLSAADQKWMNEQAPPGEAAALPALSRNVTNVSHVAGQPSRRSENRTVETAAPSPALLQRLATNVLNLTLG